MSELSSLIALLDHFAITSPSARGIDLRIFKGGAQIVATVTRNTAVYMPYHFCSDLPVWDAGVVGLGDLVGASTCLTWRDMQMQLTNLQNAFEVFLEARDGPNGPFTSGLFLIFR